MRQTIEHKLQIAQGFSKRNLLKILVPFFAIVFISIFILEIPNLYILSNRGIQIDGTIIKFETEGNRTFYEYSFGGKSYRYDFTYHKGASPTFPKKGDKWQVTIDPERPSRHSLGDATAQFTDSLNGLAFITIGMFVITVFRTVYSMSPSPFQRFNRKAKEKWERSKKDPFGK